MSGNNSSKLFIRDMEECRNVEVDMLSPTIRSLYTIPTDQRSRYVYTHTHAYTCIYTRALIYCIVFPGSYVIIIIILVIIIIRHWGRTSMNFSLPRECGRSRPPESEVAPLGSASHPKATPVRDTTLGRWDLLTLVGSPARRRKILMSNGR